MAVSVIDTSTYLPHGLSDDLTNEEIHPTDAIKADLAQGEKVIAQYEVYYPGKMMPFWLYLLLCICTFGLFALYYECLKFSYRNCRTCCKPTMISMTRGCMAITNIGRVLVWEAAVDQQSTGCCCCRSSTYDMNTVTRQYMLKDVSEVSFECRKKAGFLCQVGFCSEKYTARVRLTMGKFDFANNGSATNGISASSLYSNISGWVAGLQRSMDFVDIVSIREDDSMYDIEHKQATDAMGSLVKVHKQIIDFVASTKADIWESPSADLAQVLKQPSFTFSEGNIADPSWVRATDVQLPRDLVALEQTETVFGAQSLVYTVTILDYLFSFATVGLYYMFVVVPKLQNRPSALFTPKRFIEFTILKGAYLIPCLPCCVLDSGLKIRSFFPTQLMSGTISRQQYGVTTNLNTTNGRITIAFGQARDTTLGNIIARNSDVVHSKVAFVQALFQSAITTPLGDPESLGMQNLGPLNEVELNLYRPHEGEVVLARYDSNVYSPWCGCDNSMLTFPNCYIGLTCGLRPFSAQQVMALTNRSVIVYNKYGNNPMCGPFSKFCRRVNSDLTWAPLENFMASSVNTYLKGQDNCVTNCCESNICGRLFCPKHASSLRISTAIANGTELPSVAVIEDVLKRGSIRNTDKLAEHRRNVSNVQQQIVSSTAVEISVPASPVMNRKE